MQVYKSTYKDKNTNKNRICQRYTIDFTDHKQIRRRLTAFANKRESLRAAEKIEWILSSRGGPLDPELSKWLSDVPSGIYNQLVSWEILNSKQAALGKPLNEHVKDFEKYLFAKGTSEKHVNQTVSRIQRVIKECKFINWPDIKGSQVIEKVAHFRNFSENVKKVKIKGKTVKKKIIKDLGKISTKTANYYIKSIKQFCKWMVIDRRAVESPLEHLKCIVVKKVVDEKHPRRALEVDELRHLFEVTRKAPLRFGMSGYERYLLYRLTAETGLRANESRSLKISSFDFKELTVTVHPEFTKNGQEAIQSLRNNTAAELKEFFKNKFPETKAFGGTYKKLTPKTSDMLQADLADAGIPYILDGLYFDFHSLRHQTGTLLAASGVHPKVAQKIMRHSDINLTMSRYTHIFSGQESEAIAKLPDFSEPSKQKQRAISTGTDGVVKSDLTLTGQNSVQRSTLADLDKKRNRVFNEKNAVLNEAEGTRTLNLRIDSPML